MVELLRRQQMLHLTTAIGWPQKAALGACSKSGFYLISGRTSPSRLHQKCPRRSNGHSGSPNCGCCSGRGLIIPKIRASPATNLSPHAGLRHVPDGKSLRPFLRCKLIVGKVPLHRVFATFYISLGDIIRMHGTTFSSGTTAGISVQHRACIRGGDQERLSQFMRNRSTDDE